MDVRNQREALKQMETDLRAGRGPAPRPRGARGGEQPAELPGAVEVGQRIVREALTELAGPPQRVSPA
jgi:hypothetical protein